MHNQLTQSSYQNQVKSLIDQLSDMLPADALSVFNSDAETLAQRFQFPLQLKVGDRAPEFELPNAMGSKVTLRSLLETGPLVVTFYRGVWCPYCVLSLKIFQEALPQFKDLGANLVAISPMTPDHSLSMQEKSALGFEVLSDVGNVVARKYTAVFANGSAPLEAMKILGIDFFDFYGDASAELPVPATFVISKSGVVLFAESEGGDYRMRTAVESVLAALQSA